MSLSSFLPPSSAILIALRLITSGRPNTTFSSQDFCKSIANPLKTSRREFIPESPVKDCSCVSKAFRSETSIATSAAVLSVCRPRFNNPALNSLTFAISAPIALNLFISEIKVSTGFKVFGLNMPSKLSKVSVVRLVASVTDCIFVTVCGLVIPAIELAKGIKLSKAKPAAVVTSAILAARAVSSKVFISPARLATAPSIKAALKVESVEVNMSDTVSSKVIVSLFSSFIAALSLTTALFSSILAWFKLKLFSVNI